MERVLITGANGFAGPYVASAMAARGYEVLGLSRRPLLTPGCPAVQEWFVADLSDPLQARKAVEESRPDVVIHLAAISFVAHADVRDIYLSNILGTRNLLDALVAVGQMTGPLIIASSGNVYGVNVGGALSEQRVINPHSDYAISKAATEYLADMYAHKVRSIIIRPFNYTGVGQGRNFLIPKIIDHIKRGAETIELGNIHVARDFSDVRFFAEAVSKLIEADVESADRINICSGVAYTLSEVIALAERVSAHRLKVKVNQDFVRANEVSKLWGDPAKLHTIIGPLKSPPLEKTIQWMIEN